MAKFSKPLQDAPGDASTSSMWFATIYPASLVGSMTCAIMSSEPCFLITTPLFDYPGQVQAVTGTVAVFSSVPANSERHFFNARVRYLTAKALFILKSTLSVSTCQIIRVSLFAKATVVFRNPRRAFSQWPRLSSRFFTYRITDRVHTMLLPDQCSQ